MNDYELSKIAEFTDEDAMDASDFELADLIKENQTASFKQHYFGYYDDIKLTPEDDW
jgi:hypothetical protein